jgi:hypothetical protein
MIGLFSLIPKPYLILAVLASLAITHSVAYFKGYQSAERKATQELVKQMEKEREYLAAIDTMGRELVKAHNEKSAETKVVYRTIIKEIPNATTGRVCFSNDAAGLWNQSLYGEMPSTPAGTADKTSGAYSDEEVLTNAVENFEQYTACRAQLNALIDWHEEIGKANAAK